VEVLACDFLGRHGVSFVWDGSVVEGIGQAAD
jgi:hypothetical protein